MRLSRADRVDDLRGLYGVTYVASAKEMWGCMTASQRLQLDRLQSEQTFLVARGAPSPRLDPALAGEDLSARVAYAVANRRLMRRVLRGE